MDAETNTPTKPFAEMYGDEDTLTKCGLRWSTETVNRETDGNASVKVVASNDAQILVIDNVAEFIANFPNGGDTLKGIANTTSLRVFAQGYNRRNPKQSKDERRQAVWTWLMGIRHAATVRTQTVTVTVEKLVEKISHPLPDGTMYEGTDKQEYQALLMAKYIDAGLTSDMARTIALQTSF